MRGGFQSGIVNGQFVVLFVERLDAPQDFDGLFDRRFVDIDRLEAALQGGVAFDIFAVLVQRCRADALQLAPGKGRFEDVGRVHRAARRARADQHVDLVDEQDAIGAFEFLDDPLEPFLELAAIDRPGHQAADVQLQHPLFQQRFGDIAADDALGQSLDDGRFAHAGVADEGRVVLGAAGQDLDDALDLGLPPDDRVQFARVGQGGQVGAQLIHGRRRALLPDAGVDRGFLHELRNPIPDLFGGRAQAAQHIHGDPFAFADQAQQQVLGADVVVVQAAGLIHSQLDHPLGAGGEGRLGVDGTRAPPNGSFHLFAHALRRDVEAFEDAHRHAALFGHQAQQNVFCADVAVVQAASLFSGSGQNPSGPFGKAIQVICHVLTSFTTFFSRSLYPCPAQKWVSRVTLPF